MVQLGARNPAPTCSNAAVPSGSSTTTWANPNDFASPEFDLTTERLDDLRGCIQRQTPGRAVRGVRKQRDEAIDLVGSPLMPAWGEFDSAITKWQDFHEVPRQPWGRWTNLPLLRTARVIQSSPPDWSAEADLRCPFTARVGLVQNHPVVVADLVVGSNPPESRCREHGSPGPSDQHPSPSSEATSQLG